MNIILKLAAALAVGSASVAVYAQSETGSSGEAYGKFRPLEGQAQAAAPPQTAAQPAPAPEAPPVQPEAPAAQPAPESAQAQPSVMVAPYGYGPGAGYGPGHMDPFGADSWARYEERKRFMRDRQMFRRYAGPRRGYYGRHSRFGPYYSGPVPYHGVPQAPAAAAPAPAPEEGQAPEAAAQPGY